MNKFLSIVLVTSFCLTLSPQGQAKEMKDCTRLKKNIKEYARCLDAVIETLDREMQTWVNSITFELEELAITAGRTAPQNMFNKAKQDYIRFRENECRWRYLAISPDPKASNIYKECYIMLTKQRIQSLKSD